MFGLRTCLRMPSILISRVCHRGSSSTLARSDVLDRGLDRPDSGEAERGEW